MVRKTLSWRLLRMVSKTTILEFASHGQENDHLGVIFAWSNRRSRPYWEVLRMVRQTTVFWVLRMVPERSDFLQGG